MSRPHYYGRVRSSYGNVQIGVDVYVYLAGTINAATVYTAASGGDAIAIAPQIQSNADGLIDFYLDASYGTSQLFDLKISGITYSNISIILGDMLKKVYDIDDDDVVDEAEQIDGGSF